MIPTLLRFSIKDLFQIKYLNIGVTLNHDKSLENKYLICTVVLS